MIDQLSSGMIGTISISIPQEENTSISRDTQLDLSLQQHEEDKVNNIEEKEQNIMRDGELATMIQQQ